MHTIANKSFALPSLHKSNRNFCLYYLWIHYFLQLEYHVFCERLNWTLKALHAEPAANLAKRESHSSLIRRNCQRNENHKQNDFFLMSTELCDFLQKKNCYMKDQSAINRFNNHVPVPAPTIMWLIYYHPNCYMRDLILLNIYF